MNFFSYNNNKIAFEHLEGAEPNILFCGGFASDMYGKKGTFLYDFCKKNKLSFTKFDYYGHGKSSGKLEDGTISIWLDNTISLIKHLNLKNLIIIGSSLGGWIMLLLYLYYKKNITIVALLGIAPAPDFIKDIILQLPSEQKNIFLNSKIITNFSPDGRYSYSFSKNFIQDAEKHYILDKKLDIQCILRIIHGLNDKVVNIEKSLKILKLLPKNTNCILSINNSTHSMNDFDSLSLLIFILTDIISTFNK